MCMGGGGSPKVETPKPSPLPPPLPAPPPPKPAAAPAKKLVAADVTPDIRIGTAKKSGTSGRDRREPTGRASQSLSIGNNQGMTL